MRRLDYKRRLIDYVSTNLKKGYTEESLKWALINQGYSKVAVEQAIQQVHKELAEKAPVIKEKPVIKYEIIDEEGKPVQIKKSWWKRVFGF